MLFRSKTSTEWTEVKNRIDQNDPGFMQKLNEVICDTLKVSDPDETLTIRNNINRNRTIVRLSTAVFPTEITQAIANSIKLENRRRFNYFKFKKTYKS